MNGAEWIVEFLKRHGTESVFGYPGGAIMPVYDALYRVGLKHLLCRHEQGAAMAAIGYARASGKTGVCLATSGPGALNLVTGLAEALADSVPLIALTGQVGTAAIGTDAFQESDVLGWSLACTKHSFLVEDVAELPEILVEALKLTKSGRPGPVLVDIPKDIQLAMCDLPFPDLEETSQEAFSCSSDLQKALQAAEKLLHSAKKPVVYVGGGVGMAGAVADLRSFLDMSLLPSVATLKALGAVSENSPFYLGMLGMHGSKAANLAVQESDLLIALGARFDDRVTGKLEAFAPEAKIIHVDIDPSEINKRRYADVQIIGDLKEVIPFLAEISQQESQKTKKARLLSWHQHLKASKKTGSFCLEKQGEAAADLPIFAPSLLTTISKILPENAIVTTDVGQHQMWSAQYMSFSKPENFITSGGMGTMGFGLPAAIGAQVARPQDRVVCISGDGSFMMNLQELATLKRGGNLAVKIVLLDNQRLGMVRQWQELFFEGRFSETILWDNPDFVHLAQAFGIKARHISKQGEIADALAEMMAIDGPYLLHVSVNASQDVWPLVPPGAGNEVMLETMEREEI